MEYSQVKIVPTHGLEREVHITVPTGVLDRITEEEIKKQARKANLKGFREGKVPDKLIDDRYGSDIRHQIIHDRVEECVNDAFEELSLKPIVVSELELNNGEKGEDLNIVVHAAVAPKIDQEKLEHLNLILPVADVTEEFIDKHVEDFRDLHKTYQSVERPATHGDELSLSFENLGSLSEPDNELVATDAPVPYGWNIATEEEEQELSWAAKLCNTRLRGCQAGDSIEVKGNKPYLEHGDDVIDQEPLEQEPSSEMTVDTLEGSGQATDGTIEQEPSSEPTAVTESVEENGIHEYPGSAADIASEGWASVNFRFDVVGVREPVLPVLDEAFFARDDIPVNDEEQLRQHIRDAAEQNIESAGLECLAEQVFTQLAEMYPFPTRRIFEERLLNGLSGFSSTTQSPDDGDDLTDEFESEEGALQHIDDPYSSMRRSDELKAAITKMLANIFVTNFVQDHDLTVNTTWVDDRLRQHAIRLNSFGISPTDKILMAAAKLYIGQDLERQVMKSLLNQLEVERVVVPIDDLTSSEYLEEFNDRKPSGAPYLWEAEQFTGFEVAPDGSYIDLAKKAAEEEAARRNRPGLIGKFRNLFRN